MWCGVRVMLCAALLMPACTGGDAETSATSATATDGECEAGIYAAPSCNLTAPNYFDFEPGCKDPCDAHADCDGDEWCLGAYVDQECDCPEGMCCDGCRARAELCFSPEEVPCVAHDEASCPVSGRCKLHSVIRPTVDGDTCTIGHEAMKCTWRASPGAINAPIESCWKPVDMEQSQGLGVFYRNDTEGALEILFGESLDSFSEYPGWTPCEWGEEGVVTPPECICACEFHPL